MKKLITILCAALLVLAPAWGQADNKDIKVSRREAKVAAKQAKAAERLIRREGFRPLEPVRASASLQRYFLKVNAGCQAIVGTSQPCISENLAKLTALANAANEYAVLQGGDLRGRITSSATSLTGVQADNLVASFERLVEKDIRGELVPYATFCRERGGMFSARAYCIVDHEAALRARRRALEMAIAEQSLAEKYGTMVSDWIDEGFWKEGERQ